MLLDDCPLIEATKNYNQNRGLQDEALAQRFFDFLGVVWASVSRYFFEAITIIDLLLEQKEIE